MEMLDESSQAQLERVEADRQRRQKAKSRRCRFCKTVVQYPNSVDKNTEKTIWEIHLASQGHQKASEQYGREWKSKCDACNKVFHSYQDWNFHVNSKRHRDAMNDSKVRAHVIE